MNDSAVPAVVLARDINGLGVVRSLYQAGIPTIVVATSAGDPVLSSRLPRQKLVVPPAADPNQALLETLGLVGAGCALIPTSDEHVAFMVAHRVELAQRFAFCMAATPVIAPLLDKQHQSELVEGLGLPVPKTVLQPRPAGDDRMLRLGLPVIFKPRSFADRNLLGKKNVVVEDAAARDLFLATHADLLPSLVAQEVVPGPDDQLWVCNCTFDTDHALVGAFTFRRLGMAPPHYGVTSYAISQRNQAVIELVAYLGRALRYVGPAMIEFKHDPRDQLYKFIELNPRLGMCNAFDTRCGVDNVLFTYRLSLGERPARSAAVQRDGVMFLSIVDDIHSRRSQGESLGATLLTYARHAARPHVTAYFRWCDPGPAAAVTLRSAGRLIQVLGRHIAGDRLESVAPPAKEARPVLDLAPV